MRKKIWKEILEAIELGDKKKLIRDLSIKRGERERKKVFNFLNTYNSMFCVI